MAAAGSDLVVCRVLASVLVGFELNVHLLAFDCNGAHVDRGPCGFEIEV
jgi:hypothetical protein